MATLATGTGVLVLSPATGSSIAFDSLVDGSLPAFVMDAPATTSIFFTNTMPSALQIAAPFSFELVPVLVIDSAGQITSAFTVELLSDAALNSALQVSDPAVVDSLIEASLFSFIGAQNIDGLAQAGGEVWVVNLDNSASTRYENFNYSSFARIAGRYYGARADGVYLLDGENDAGSAIAARIDFGRRDFNTTMGKRLEAAYMAVGCYGTMYLRVTDNEGNVYTYAARRHETQVKQHRVDVGRGFQATVIQFEILNDAAGADFELAGAEFMAVELTRRIR